jgi:hypothetical protein
MTTQEIKDFKNALHNGVVEFKYTKVNGDERVARGTLLETTITEDGGLMPKGVMKVSDETIRYYDLDSNGWRSFRIDNFIGIVE